MGDNINVTPGSGTTVATRSLSVNSVPSIEVPYGILGWESAGSLVVVSASTGLPVNLLNVSVAITAAALPLPTGAATSALQTTGNGSLASILSALGGSLAVTGTFYQATQPVSAAALPLPTGAATSALQTTGNGSLASILSALGGSLAVTGTFYQATQPVSAAALPLPTLAATSALQTTGNASLASIATGVVAPIAAGTNVIGVAVAPQQTGAIYSGTTALTPLFAVITASSSARRPSSHSRPGSRSGY